MRTEFISPAIDDATPLRDARVPFSRIGPGGETLEDGAINLVAIGGASLRGNPDSVTLVTQPGQWAYSAEANFEIPGIESKNRIVRIGLEVESGVLGVGWLREDQSVWITRTSATAELGEKKLSLVIPAQTRGGKLVFDNWTQGGKPAIGVIRSIIILENIEMLPTGDSDGEGIPDEVDPVVEGLWPLDSGVFSTRVMRNWSRAAVESALTGDSWRDNLIFNKWEFATGASRLASYPWRFSVPFVLCNARCDFCSAWLVKGRPMPIDLLDRLDIVLPYLAEIDLVGWGEPLIHPEFGTILAKLQTRADRRARISLTTNGVHLKKWVVRLIDANVRDVAVSIHAASPITHEDVMGLSSGTFEHVIEGVRVLAACRQSMSRLRIGLVFIVMRQNIGEIPKFIDLAKELGVDSVFFRTLKPQTKENYLKDGLDYHRLPPYLHPEFEKLRQVAIEAIWESSLQIEATPETWGTPVFPAEFEEEILRAALRPRETRRAEMRAPISDSESLPVGEPLDVGQLTNEGQDNAILIEQLENPYDRPVPFHCPSPYTALYINGFDRSMSPCCYMSQVPGYKLSYLRKGANFDDVWNSPAMMELRRSLHKGPLKQPCLKCPFYW